MGKIICYNGQEILFEGECPACEINKSLIMPCGVAFEDDILALTQDFELPIVGMLVAAPKRHIEFFQELTSEERNHLFDIINQTIIVLKKHNVAKEFNVIFEEKKGRHFHIWILPRDGWKERGIDPTKDIRALKKYALDNFSNEETYREIERVSNLVGEEIKAFYLR